MKQVVILTFLAAILVSGRTGLAQEEAAAPEAAAEGIVMVPADEKARLMELAGQVVRVEGELNRVGATSEGGITFLNMSKVPDGFVAIVFRKDLGMFPDGFDAFLNKRIAVTGTVQIYEDRTPQIVIGSPAQVEIVEEVAAP